MSLDNQTFLSWLVDSFVNFFQLQNFRLFLYFSFVSSRIWWGWGAGGSGGWGLEVTVFWEGQTVGGSVDPGTVFSLKKNTILTQLMCSFCKRSINLEESISTRLPTTIVTHVLHNNSWLFKRWITTLFTSLSG